jgi:hypothetical protein
MKIQHLKRIFMIGFMSHHREKNIIVFNDKPLDSEL